MASPFRYLPGGGTQGAWMQTNLLRLPDGYVYLLVESKVPQVRERLVGV